MSFLRQLVALLRKDIVIRKFKRHYILAILEYLLPLLIWGGMVYAWTRIDAGVNTEVSGQEKAYDPIGPYESSDLDLFGRRIYFTPNSSAYASQVTNAVFGSTMYSVHGFKTTTEMEIALGDDVVSLALMFPSEESEQRLEYTMRWGPYDGMNTDIIFPFLSEPRIARGGTGAEPYFDRSEKKQVWPLMYSIFIEHLKFFKLGPVVMPKLQALPTPAYTRSSGERFFPFLASLTSIFIFASFLIFLSTYSKNVMQDKESRLRELLRMMGLADSVYWTNAFLVGLLNALPICVLITIAMCANFGVRAIVMGSSPLLLFIVLLCYAIGIILLALLFSVLVKSAKLGSALVLLAQVVGLVISLVLDPPGSTNYLSVSAFIKLITSMYSPCGMHWALKIIFYREGRESGVTWSNLFEIAIDDDKISLGGVLLMMIFSWFFWSLVILYLDAIIPWQYGLPKPPLFFLKASYWFPNKYASNSELADSRDSLHDGSAEDMVEKSNNTDTIVRLDRVTHSFGAVRAVDDLSLELFGKQITVLLGHNGAGKTTVMNILTGLFPPTRGNIFINGYNVRESTKKAREGIGLCPQHNVLFDDLTVREHLQFFAMLKSSASIDSEVPDLLSKLELDAKANTLSKALSGGMKRKLSLANAMVGGSSILILDEPSSGLDPEARRVVWSLLQDERTRRTVLMTTHYMEEADVLGDRIAFVAKGKLMCAGSPMFLKRKFETGYKLRLTKVDQSVNPESIVSSIKELLPQNANNVHLVSDMSYESVINIGFPGSIQMITLFRHLEENQQQLGIESLGTSVTTMEDVFLKVGQREEDLAAADKKGETCVNVFESFPRFQRLSGFSLIMRQTIALIIMRFHTLRRDSKIIGYMCVLPLIFALILGFILVPGDGIGRTKALTYSNKLLGAPEGFLAGGGSDPVAEVFTKHLTESGVSITSLESQKSKEELDKYFLEQAKADASKYRKHMYAGILKNSESIYFNGQPYHIGAAALANWQVAQLERLTSKASFVNVTNHPQETKSSQSPVQETFAKMRLLTVIIGGIIFCYVSCTLIITPIQERVRKSKLIQIMSGVNPLVYINANFVFDGAAVLICLILCLIVLLCFNNLNAFTSSGETIPTAVLIFLLFIFGSTPWTYILSYLFTSSTTGFSVYSGISFLLVLLAGVVFGSLESFTYGSLGNYDAYLYLLNFVPVFAASWSFGTNLRNGCVKSLFEIVGAEKLCGSMRPHLAVAVFCGRCTDEVGFPSLCYQEHSVYNMNLFTGIGFSLIALTVMGVVGWILLIFIEMNSRRFAHVADSINLKKLFSCRRDPNQGQVMQEVSEDSAVQTERQVVYDIVTNNRIKSHALVAKDMTKYYGSLRAVNNISFHVEKNECFGLLGVNGAGKTTTFGMLTGDFLMTAGNSYIENTDVRSQLQAYQEYIGYCPQFDALVDTLTGREMLSLFCGLRGVPTDRVKSMISFMTAMADLKPHIDKLTKSYSGGNKRKLSLAIAMIGNPPVMFLDEPTAGVDPGARRKIWATLNQAQKELNSSVVLTSHSMDECEALCHRLVIMFRGTFRCLGSSQQIKSRYGQGFTVLIKLKSTEEDQQVAVENTMRHLFMDQCELKDSYQCLLQFHVNDPHLRWSEVFERIEKLRETSSLLLEDVQVSDTTLEQVFLNFAKESAKANPAMNGTHENLGFFSEQAA